MNVFGISATGRVAVAAEFSGGADPLSGIYLGDASGQTPVAIEDAATPVSGKFFRRFYHDAAVLNDAGQVVFLAELSDTINGPLAGRGLFFYDPANGLQQIARSGDMLAESTINDIYFTGTMLSVSTQSPDTSRTGMNQAGQVAFMFELNNGKLGIGVWSADPNLPGDYNADQSVDTADYIMWRDNEGTNNLLPNSNNLPGPIGNDHYNLWRANFGKQPSNGAALGEAAVLPEPATWLLAIAPFAALANCRR